MRLGPKVAWVGALALQLVMSIVVLPGYSRLQASFGGEEPWVTALVCSAGFRYGFLAWLALAGGLALVGRRRGLMAAVLGSCAVVWVTTLFAVYAPLFALAGQVRE